MRRRALLLALLALAASARASARAAGAGSGAASAEGGGARRDHAFAVEILVLYASNEHQGIDARIGEMSELTRPPFSAYDSYRLLDRRRLPLERRSARTLRLPNGRVLKTRLLEVLAPDTVRLSASIDQGDGKQFLPLLEVKAKLGEAFIVAGQRYQKGVLVLVIRVL